jgi:hypothetical protein
MCYLCIPWDHKLMAYWVRFTRYSRTWLDGFTCHLVYRAGPHTNSAMFFTSQKLKDVLCQRCTSPGCQVREATKFCTGAPHVCGSWVWNVLYLTQLTPRILRCLLEFWGIYASMMHAVPQVRLFPYRSLTIHHSLTILLPYCEVNPQ